MKKWTHRVNRVSRVKPSRPLTAMGKGSTSCCAPSQAPPSDIAMDNAQSHTEASTGSSKSSSQASMPESSASASDSLNAPVLLSDAEFASVMADIERLDALFPLTNSKCRRHVRQAQGHARLPQVITVYFKASSSRERTLHHFQQPLRPSSRTPAALLPLDSAFNAVRY